MPDGLLPKLFAEVHPKICTSHKCNLVLYIFVGLLGGFLPGGITGNMTNLGTLFAFALACIGVSMGDAQRESKAGAAV
jgi:APA family basic amino acid/polyamine antiporter